MPITLDIAGLFFSETVDYLEGDTIRDVVNRVQAKTAASGYAGPRLEVTEEAYSGGGFTVNSITVTHKNNSAVSRQILKDSSGQVIVGGDGQPLRRQYENGIYHFSDDAVSLNTNDLTSPLLAADPNKPVVFAWQYYVYDTEFRDVARARAGNVAREIVPYSAEKTKSEIADGYTIVWRLVGIFVRPTHADRGDIRISTRGHAKLA